MKEFNIFSILLAAVRSRHLRKREWCPDNMSVFKGMQIMNEFLEKKYVISRGIAYFDLKMEQRSSRVVGMTSDFYYQVVVPGDCCRSQEISRYAPDYEELELKRK